MNGRHEFGVAYSPSGGESNFWGRLTGGARKTIIRAAAGINGIPGYLPSNKIPYSEQVMFSLQRQLGQSTVLSATSVGTLLSNLSR